MVPGRGCFSKSHSNVKMRGDPRWEDRAEDLKRDTEILEPAAKSPLFAQHDRDRCLSLGLDTTLQRKRGWNEDSAATTWCHNGQPEA